MKKFFIGFLVLVVIGSLLQLCDGGSQDNIDYSKLPELKNVVSTEVYGEDANLISIIPDTYQLVRKNDQLRLKVKLKLEQTTHKDCVSQYPIVVLKDEDGVEILNGKQMELTDSEKEKLKAFIMQDKIGTIKEFIFVNGFSGYLFERVLAESESFSIDKIKLFNQKESDEDFKDAVNAVGSLFGDSKENKDKELQGKKKTDEKIDKAVKQTEDLIETTGKMIEVSKGVLEMAKELQ